MAGLKTIRTYFPRFQIECHKEPWQAAGLVVELARHGVECVLEPDARCRAVLVASFLAAADAATGYMKAYNRTTSTPFPGYRDYPHLKVVYYCWDLYPWQVEGRHEGNKDYAWRWPSYLQTIRDAHDIWVPSQSAGLRVQQYIGRSSFVMKAGVPFWEPDTPPGDEGYVVDVMRKYPNDPNRDAVREVCEQLNIPCVETGADLSWDRYRRVIANARLLVSAYQEATTGSLALVEGHRLGKPVLLAEGPRNGGVDYFGPRATYFRWDDREDLKTKIQQLFQAPPALDASECRAWADQEYSDQAFARRMAERLREIVQ